MTKRILCGLLSLISLSGCNKDETPAGNPSLYTIHAAGSVSEGTARRAVYWKDGARSVLSDQASSATAITLIDTDVYIAGMVTEGSTSRPVYWKNGVQHTLPGTMTYFPETIQADQGNLYIFGRTGLMPGSSKRYTGYWKNGLWKELTPSSATSDIYWLRVSNGQLCYLETNSSGKTAGRYFKNGMATELPGDSCSASFLQVSGADVYVAGIRSRPFGYSGDVVLWKNGALRQISRPEEGQYMLRGLIVYNGDHYILASRTDINTAEIKCWKNGTAYTSLSLAGFAPAGFLFAGNDLFAYGQYTASGSPYHIAALHLNGQFLPLEATAYSSVAGMVAVPKK